MNNSEILEFFYKHMQSIQDNDTKAYHATVSEDLSVYEWWVTPQRLDGVPFHEFMMSVNSKQGTVFGVEGGPNNEVRFDYANMQVQHYGNTAILSYTLLVSSATSSGVKVSSHNESRVIIKLDGEWKVVHVHKSPAWSAPHMAPSGGAA